MINPRELERIKSDLSWTGYMQDLAHNMRSLVLRMASSEPLSRILEQILAPTVVDALVKLKDPDDGRRTKDVKCRVLVIEVLDKDAKKYPVGLR